MLRADEAQGRPFRLSTFLRSLSLELAVGLGVVLTVAVLLSLSTSKDAWDAHQRLGFASTSASGRVELTLRAMRAPGDATVMAVDVTDRRPGGPGAAGEVLATVGGRERPLTALPESTIATRRFGLLLPAAVPFSGDIRVDLPPPGPAPGDAHLPSDLRRAAGGLSPGGGVALTVGLADQAKSSRPPRTKSAFT